MTGRTQDDSVPSFGCRRDQPEPSSPSTVLIKTKLQSVIDRRSGALALFGASNMEKLQEIVDTVFGSTTSQPKPQSPSAFTIQRQRAFDEAARKLEALRRARLERNP